jgi:hypothetical protein
MTSPRTQGINRNPIKKVTDPHNIKAIEIPRSNEANPAGVICDIIVDVEGYRLILVADEESSDGDGGDRRRVSTRADSS